MPELRGHPYVPQKVKGTEGIYINVARFPMAADAAEGWYEDAAAGVLRLPAHPDKATPGDGSLLLAPPTLVEPQGGGESMAMDLPFLPASHGAAYVRGLFPDAAPERLGWELEDETAEWLADQLFFDLREPENSPYLGALLHVRYGSRLRAVERHLAPRADGGDDEVVRLTTWPGADMAGAELIAVERRLLGVSEPVRIPITSSLMRIQWPGKVGETGLAIVHPKDGLCWWSNILPFVRTIVSNVDVGVRRRQVVVPKTKETYEVTEVVSARPGGPILIGDGPAPLSVSARHISAQAAQERRRIATALGLRWFDDPATAANHIRALLHRARQYVWMVDPYFTGVEVVRFALAVPSRGVPVTIFTSAEHLRSRVNGVELSDNLLRPAYHSDALTVIGSSLCHSRAWLPREESRSFPPSQPTIPGFLARAGHARGNDKKTLRGTQLSLSIA